MSCKQLVLACRRKSLLSEESKRQFLEEQSEHTTCVIYFLHSNKFLVSAVNYSYYSFWYLHICIVANRPGMAGTVPEVWALSRCPGGIPGCPGIYEHLALRLSLA